jgi:putative membrane protein
MKTLSYLLIASAMVAGAACSTSNSASGASETPASSATETRAGTDMNPTPAPDANSGQTPSGADASAGGSADMAAFTATFATMQDPVFLMNAASSNMMEIRTGQMAAQKATTPEIRKFAQMMVSQHNQSAQELRAIASPLGVKLPETMMPVHQALADRLNDKRGKDFDEAYMGLMDDAHKMDIAMFEAKSAAAETPSVKEFATKTLPMLHSQYDMANSIKK